MYRNICMHAPLLVCCMVSESRGWRSQRGMHWQAWVWWHTENRVARTRSAAAVLDQVAHERLSTRVKQAHTT